MLRIQERERQVLANAHRMIFEFPDKITSARMEGNVEQMKQEITSMIKTVESVSLLRKASIFRAYVARLLGELTAQLAECEDGVSSIISGEGKGALTIVI